MKQIPQHSGFGLHLLIDLWGCPKEILSNLAVHFDYLNEVPGKIEMLKITQPYVFPYCGKVPQDKGITGVVIIAESHLSVHSFQEKGFVFLDIFSCQSFDTEAVLKEVKKRFRPKSSKSWIIKRGENFHRG